MKKLVYFAAVIAAASLTACNAQAPKANLSSSVDSLSYMIGVANTQGLDMYITQQLGIDSANIVNFRKGVLEGFNKTSKADEAYMAGVQIGQQVAGRMYDAMNERIFAGDSTQKLSKDNLIAGFIAAMTNKAAITPDSANIIVEQKMKAIRHDINLKKYADNKATGEKFLAENAKKDSVMTLPDGLQYKVIKQGTGALPVDSSMVKVNYRGTLVDGTEFDSSYKRNAPATFRVDRVIKGWTEILKMMPVGSKYQVYIPQELAYGEEGGGAKILPFSTLIFDIELVEIEAKK